MKKQGNYPMGLYFDTSYYTLEPKEAEVVPSSVKMVVYGRRIKKFDNLKIYNTPFAIKPLDEE